MPGPPPPPPPPGPPPPPAAFASSSAPPASKNKLLSEIRNPQVKLKKTVTNDRSAPIVSTVKSSAGPSSSSSSVANGNPHSGSAMRPPGSVGGGGLFGPDGVPKLPSQSRNQMKPAMPLAAANGNRPSPPSAQKSTWSKDVLTSAGIDKPATSPSPPPPPSQNRKPSMPSTATGTIPKVDSAPSVSQLRQQLANQTNNFHQGGPPAPPPPPAAPPSHKPSTSATAKPVQRPAKYNTLAPQVPSNAGLNQNMRSTSDDDLRAPPPPPPNRTASRAIQKPTAPPPPPPTSAHKPAPPAAPPNAAMPTSMSSQSIGRQQAATPGQQRPSLGNIQPRAAAPSADWLARFVFSPVETLPRPRAHSGRPKVYPPGKKHM